MSDCLDNTQCSPVASQAFPAPLPEGIPADVISYAFEGVCPDKSGLDPCGGQPITVSKALDQIESKLCALNPKGIAAAPDCSPIVVKGGIATPVTALQALNCLPRSIAGDVPQFNGAEWVIGPLLRPEPDCSYPCPPAPNLILTSTGVNTATWQSKGDLTAIDTPSIDLNLAGTTLKADVKLSPDLGNILQITPNGLKAIAPAFSDTTTVGSSPTVNMTLNGSNITTDVIVSPAIGNSLQVTPSGLFVPTAAPKTVSGGVTDTAIVVATVTGNNTALKVDVILDSIAGNALVQTTSGLKVIIPPISCTDLTPLLDPASPTTCYGNKADTPTRILSTGATGIGYRTLPLPGAIESTTVSDTPSIDLTLSGTNVTADVRIDPAPGNQLTIAAGGLRVTVPASGPTTNVLSLGTSTAISQPITSTVNGVASTINIPIAAPYTAAITSTVNTTISSTNVISSVANISTTPGNKLTSNATGLLVLPPTCPEVIAGVSPTSNAGCIPTAAVCALPTALMGHLAGVPSYFAGKPLYTAEAYPTTNGAQQVLSNTGSTLNDITSLMQILPGDENGLCPGEASFWDPALSRFTITRPGRYTYHWGLFMRLIMSNNTLTANNSLYAGVRFIRPAGVVNGRSVSAQANTLRGTQFTLNVGAPTANQDWESTGSHTFIATAGTQLSLRAVAILGSGAAITSFIVRGDSGHFSLSELPDRQL